MLLSLLQMTSKPQHKYQLAASCSNCVLSNQLPYAGVFVMLKTQNKLYLGCFMLGLLCLGQLLLEMCELLLSRRQVSALPGELLLQLG